MPKKLILAEKPSVAQNIAHSLGAREKVYGSGGKNYCYANDDYYVVNAVGHLYGVGMPEDYGFKEWKLDTLPIFPEFKICPTDPSKDGVRSLISELMNNPDVTEIICATDAGREGELIFRHIYNANNCTKPVQRLWINSVTDEAIREGMANLKPMSDYDNMYAAAFTREKLDWIIGMNLSRLYGIKDEYPHKIGRVKTPLLSIIADRDKEIENFVSQTSYKLLLDNGAESTEEFPNMEEAEEKKSQSVGKLVNVTAAEKVEKTENRPLLYSLTSLQMDANDLYGFTADETLAMAQSLYEKKLLTYPRTDSEYISEDMKPLIESIVKMLSDSPVGNSAEHAKKLLSQGLNIDKRIIDNSKIDDHHAIIITNQSLGNISVSDNERKLYDLVVNRLLMALDKPHVYMAYEYEFWCEDITYKLSCKKTIQSGWKAYRPKYEGEAEEENTIPEYSEGSSFTADNITVKDFTTQPKKHFTDKTLLSVMKNIDNRIDDKALKSAVSERGIGTSATRAEIIKQLIEAEYVERKGKQLIATPFGRNFIDSLPDNVKSVERTAEWEQYFNNIQEKGISPDELANDVKTFIKTTITYENSRERAPVHHENANAPKREAIGTCPRCGKQIFEGKSNFYCESGKDGCGFVIWKENKFYLTTITAEMVTKLLDGKAIPLKAKNRDGETYSANYQLDDTGEYVNFKRIKTEKTPVGKCPRCGKQIFEGKSNFYCESGKDGCGFALWKEDKFNGITVTAKAAADLLNKGKATISKKTLNGTEKAVYSLVDTGKYINLKKEE